jgi:hypothetical protein
MVCSWSKHTVPERDSSLDSNRTPKAWSEEARKFLLRPELSDALTHELNRILPCHNFREIPSNSDCNALKRGKTNAALVLALVNPPEGIDTKRGI